MSELHEEPRVGHPSEVDRRDVPPPRSVSRRNEEEKQTVSNSVPITRSSESGAKTLSLSRTHCLVRHHDQSRTRVAGEDEQGPRGGPTRSTERAGKMPWLKVPRDACRGARGAGRRSCVFTPNKHTRSERPRHAVAPWVRWGPVCVLPRAWGAEEPRDVGQASLPLTRGARPRLVTESAPGCAGFEVCPRLHLNEWIRLRRARR